MLFLAGTVACGAGASAPHDAALRLKLANGTPVALVAGNPAEGEARVYRYLPANLAIAVRRDGMPEFSFLLYREDATHEVEGAIMHLLLQWGLSEAQESEVGRALKSRVDSTATLMGAMPVLPLDEGSSWDISARGAIGALLNRSLGSAGKVPLAPGTKLAMSFRFNAKDAVRMDEALRTKRGAWGEKIRFRFLLEDTGEEWTLESDLGTLLPRIGAKAYE
jgi:hypothetical protein